MSATEKVHAQIDEALKSVDDYLAAGANGRQEKAIASALNNVAEAVRELAGPAKATKAAAEPKGDAAPAAKAPAKKAAAKGSSAKK